MSNKNDDNIKNLIKELEVLDIEINISYSCENCDAVTITFFHFNDAIEFLNMVKNIQNFRDSSIDSNTNGLWKINTFPIILENDDCHQGDKEYVYLMFDITFPKSDLSEILNELDK